MNKKVNMNVLIGQDYIEINAMQYINNKNVCIFSQKWTELNLTKSQKIVYDSLKRIEKTNQAKINSVNLILDDFSFTHKNFVVNTKIIEETFEFKEAIELNDSTLNNFKNSILKKLNLENGVFKLFSLIPFKFVVYDSSSANESLTYSTFPFGIKASKIKCLFSVRYINSSMYSSILEIFSNVNLKFENVVLNSQLSIYKNENISHSNKMNFTFDIQDKKSLLITSVNEIVIATDELKFSYGNLIEKISNKFGVSNEEAKNLISCYGEINVSEQEKNKIIHLSNDESKYITKESLSGVIKSFLKTLAIDIDKIIEIKTNEFTRDYQINIVGKLENLTNIDKYCSKYFGNNRLITLNNRKSESFFNWRYENIKTISTFLNIVDNKVKNKYYGANRYEMPGVQNQVMNKKQSFFNKGSRKRLQQPNPLII